MTDLKTASVAAGVSRAVALLLAALLLINQFLAAWEATSDASPYARASVMVTMASLALLPVCVEAARHHSRTIAAALVVTMLAFLLYSLPITIGRTAAPQERERTAFAHSVSVRQLAEKAHKKAESAVEEAKAWVADCADKYRNCKQKEDILAGRKADERAAADELKAAIVDVPDETPSHLPEWFSTARSIAYALGMDLGIAALVALAVYRRQEEIEVEEPEPMVPVKRGTGANAWLSRYLNTRSDNVSLVEAYGEYEIAWRERGKQPMAKDKFRMMFDKEAKRRGLVAQQAGRRRIYVAA